MVHSIAISDKKFCVNSKIWGDGYCDATFLELGFDDGGDCIPSCNETRVDGLRSVNSNKKCLRNLTNSIQYLTYLGGDGIDFPIEASFNPEANIVNILVRSH